MMKTSRIALWILCLAFLASCGKDNGTTSNRGFRAIAEQGTGDGSRTYLDGSAVKWDENDQIVVRNTKGQALGFDLDEGANTSYGTFRSNEVSDSFFSPNYTAIYPATSTDGTANTITSATTATFGLPAVQTYRANSFGTKAMPMMACSTDEDIEFKNVLGGVVFPLTYTHNLENCTYLVKRVVVTSNNTADVLWGTCATTISGVDGAANLSSSVTNSATDKHIITLDCGEGVQLIKDTPVDFTVMVPAGTLESGFTLTVIGDMIYNGETFANEELYEQSVSWTSGTHEGFIVRSRLSKVQTALEIKKVRYTVNYLEVGTERYLAPSKIVKGLLGASVTENAIDIDGYDWIYYEQTLTLAAENTENVIVFYYNKQSEPVLTTVTIFYIDCDTNEKIIPDSEISASVGDTLTVDAPEIEGYTPFLPSLTFVVEPEMTIAFIYYYSLGPEMSAD